MSGIKIGVDLKSVSAGIGAVIGLSEAASDPTFFDQAIRNAFVNANEQFDNKAIAAGQTGLIKHMFEWGTAGINPERTTRILRPNSPEAQLWHTNLRGRNGEFSIDFDYKQSRVPVPLPRVVRTKVPMKFLKRMQENVHYFNQKARVFEDGIQVHIEPVKSKRLFVPSYGITNAKALGKNRSTQLRGYSLVPGPITQTPGKHVAGNFHYLFSKFWEGEGSKFIESYVTKRVQEVFDKETATAFATRGTYQPAGTESVTVEAQATARQVSKSTKGRMK